MQNILAKRLKHLKPGWNNTTRWYATVHILYTSYQFAFDKAQTIGQAQIKAGRLFIKAIYSDDNSINIHDPWYGLIKDRLTKWTAFMYYKKPCTKIYKRWQSDLANWPMKAPANNMNIFMTPSIDSNLPLKTPIFVFIKKIKRSSENMKNICQATLLLHKQKPDKMEVKKPQELHYPMVISWTFLRQGLRCCHVYATWLCIK